MKIGSGPTWFPLIVRLSLSLSVLVAIGEDCRMVRSSFGCHCHCRCWSPLVKIAAWFALIVLLSLSLSVLVAIGEDRCIKQGKKVRIESKNGRECDKEPFEAGDIANKGRFIVREAAHRRGHSACSPPSDIARRQACCTSFT
jgi:hypothetical protein